MSPLDLIAREMAKPMTHLVVVTYACGKVARYETRGAAQAETRAHLERQKIGRDLISRNPDLTAGPIVRVVDVAITDKATLGAEYAELVGYNPFEDSPEITLSEVSELLTGVREEHAKAESGE